MTQPPPPPPAWVRIADAVARRIIDGRYQDRIPSKAVLAGEFGVYPGTVQRALGALAAHGVIRREPGHPYYISRNFVMPASWADPPP